MGSRVAASSLKLQPKQLVVIGLAKSATFLLLFGGSRSGKTFVACLLIVIRALKYPKSRHLIARLRFAHAKASIWRDTLPKVIHALGLPAEAYIKNESDYFYLFKNGSEVWLDGLDDKDRVEKILGREYNSIFLNEVSQIAYSSVVIVLTRLSLAVTGCRNVFYADCNPSSPSHWAHRMFVQKVDPDTRRPLKDPSDYGCVLLNPMDNLENLIPGYVEKFLDPLPESARRRFKLGEWVAAEGLVYSEFSEAVHCVPAFTIPASWMRFRAVDFGYEHPFVCLWLAESPEGKLYVYRQIYWTHRIVAEHAREIQRLTAESRETVAYTVTDHDAEDRATLDSCGIKTIPANKAVSPGIQEVKQRLTPAKDGKPRICFLENSLVEVDPWLVERGLPTCLEEEFPLYAWATRARDGAAQDVPVKMHDHGMDAIRYGCMSRITQTVSPETLALYNS